MARGGSFYLILFLPFSVFPISSPPFVPGSNMEAVRPNVEAPRNIPCNLPVLQRKDT
jgi:hypothetical protein